ncbi:MAG: CHAT domain-containing protein [Deltaproteobacteria bacterium]
MPSSESLILEIHWVLGELKMSLYPAAEAAGTVKQYSRCPISLEYVSFLCNELSFLIDRSSNGKLNAAGLATLRDNGQLLWEHLLTAEVKAALKAKPSALLSLLMDEELVFIPWELLFDGSEFLCLRFDLGRLMSTPRKAHMASSRELSGKPRMLVIADPTSDLPSAYSEGLAIRKKFDCSGKVKVDFVSKRIDTASVKRSLHEYDIVHFAGHCEYDGARPDRTGWLLSDGFLSPEDISRMAVAGPGLVFSNSCHSARSEGGDLEKRTYCLASAFLLSGVRHYLGTMRGLEDSSGLRFAGGFYPLLLQGRPIGEAFRLARKILKNADPSNVAWACYVLYGDPGYTLEKNGKRYRGRRGLLENLRRAVAFPRAMKALSRRAQNGLEKAQS